MAVGWFLAERASKAKMQSMGADASAFHQLLGAAGVANPFNASTAGMRSSLGRTRPGAEHVLGVQKRSPRRGSRLRLCSRCKIFACSERASRIINSASGRGGLCYCGGQPSGLKNGLPSPTTLRAIARPSCAFRRSRRPPWSQSSPNGTDLRPPNRTPSTGNQPSRCLYQTPAAMGGRAEHPWLHGGHLERQNAQDGLAMTRRR
jgi:hypothetical protein